MSSDPSSAPPAAWRAGAVRLAALWLLSGALLKLFAGSPQAMPELARALLPGSLLDEYRLAIAAEGALAALVLLRPRWGWAPLVGVLLLFEVVLANELARGAESCGCLGRAIQPTPTHMMIADAVALLGVLLARPWSLPHNARPHWLSLPLAMGVAIAAPWLYIHEASAPPPADPDAAQGGADAPSFSTPAGRGFVDLSIEEWVGQDVWQTDLSGWIDFDVLPLDALYVLYRQTCDVCAEHLIQLAMQPLDRPLVLVQVREAHDSPDNAVVTILPEGPLVTRVALPPDAEYLLTTPADFVVEGGVITQARHPVPEGAPAIPE